MSQPSVAYTFGFAAALCAVCSVLVAGSAVSLKDKQEANKILDRRKKVLQVAGLMQEGESLEPAQIDTLFEQKIEARLVDLDEGTYYAGQQFEANSFDQRKVAKDPAYSEVAPKNNAKVSRVPEVAVTYHVKGDGGSVNQLILPIEGKGLWSTLYGYLCVETDTNTICGITFYEHAETPGLGGEVDNPSWKAQWPGREIRDADGDIAIRVVKGKAGSVESAPHEVDGLSGATLTSNGVTYTLQFWLGENGWGPYLDNFKSGSAG
jgi:Na+-transporting NADH:ubiquinone oxidoreductase subunit C